ncbi:MAG TPA: FGGY family carbohydrate kinase [Thermotogota bacterium]|nr:FGGY family carbohydrate kinase [Thermotogota bacterium]
MGINTITVDLGASGTKVYLCELKDQQFKLHELDRFESFAYAKGPLHFWDVDRLFERIMETVRRVRKSRSIASIGFDGWGVDFVPLDEHDNKLSDPLQYFAMFKLSESIEKEIQANRKAITQAVPTQYQPFNTVYQLIYFKKENPEWFSRIKKIVSIPSYLAGRLAKRYVYEFTHATTTQLYDYQTRQWSEQIIHQLGFGQIFPEVVNAGTVIGEDHGMDIILPATHDTASAYAAITSEPATTLNISLGTWCLNGIILKAQTIPANEIEFNNYAVEGCYDNDLRILANTPGLLLWEKAKKEIQEQLGKAITYKELEQMALESGNDDLAMDVEQAENFTGNHLLETIGSEIGSQESGKILNAILNGIAKRIGQTKADMERLFNKRLAQVHIIGGGVNNRLLCNRIAQATCLPVKTHPSEGTTIGNAMIQMLGTTHIPSIPVMKSIIDQSTAYKHY